MRMRCKQRYGAWRRWGSAMVLGLAAAAAQAAHVVEPVPAWVDWAEPGAAPERKSGDDRIALLTDDQALFDGERSAWFHRRVSQVLASSGSNEASELSIDFDPAYETVVLHGAWVERDGRREDRLAEARIDELRREEGLEDGLIDGKHTLHLVLDDVRVGDRVDFALSLRGRNPALAGQDYGYWSLAVGIPTRERRLRLLHRASQELPLRVIGALPEPVRGAHDGFGFVEWRLRDARPRRGEDETVSWFDAGPSVEFGGARDWAAVVDWARPLYDAALDDAAIATLAKELKLERGDASEAAVLRAIAFVQDEIRYTGLELGAHAYQPYPPGEVIRRRYGDCKDKATLLVGLLRHLGLQAHPALVDVDEREHVAERLPSPNVFDHVVVHFVRDGRSYWIDATAQMQRGTLERLVQADFGRALVIAPGETGLRKMAVPALDAPQIDIEETFDLRDGQGGLADDADYFIRTVYRGADADAVRRRFASDSAQSIGEAYAEAIADDYPGLELATPPRIEDDTARNEVTVHEHYRIDEVWRPQDEDDGGGTHVTFWLNEIDGYLPAAGRPRRHSPRAWHGPFDIRQKLVVELDGGWPTSDKRLKVDNPHFRFERHARNDGERLVLDGRLRLLSREVPATEARRLAADIDRAENWMGYELTLGADDATAEETEEAAQVPGSWLDWRLLPVLLAVLATWGWIVTCGLRAGDSVWRGMWFHPRSTARAALRRGHLGEAAMLLVLGTMASALMETERVANLEHGPLMLLALLGAGAVGGLVGLLAYALYAGLMAWGGRLLGGRGRVGQVWMGIGWAQVPAVAMLPTLALLVALYGIELDAEGGGPALVAMVLALVLLGLPLGVWSALIWFPVLAEVHGITLRRAVAVSFAVPLAVFIVLMLSILGVRVLAGA
jgi:hypothetical protein